MFNRYLNRVADLRNDPFFPTALPLALWLALWNAGDYEPEDYR